MLLLLNLPIEIPFSEPPFRYHEDKDIDSRVQVDVGSRCTDDDRNGYSSGVVGVGKGA